MPVEYRNIHFSLSEIQAAVVHYGQIHGLKFTHAPIEGIDVLPNDETGVVVRFGAVEEAGPRIAPLKLDRAEFAAALISYCQVSKMPVPHQAAKAMRKTPHGGVALLERIIWRDAWDSEPPPG